MGSIPYIDGYKLKYYIFMNNTKLVILSMLVSLMVERFGNKEMQFESATSKKI